MATKTYWEKLKDPRWQRRRLEIMDRDEFSCVNCGADDKTLNVHHKFYKRGCAPWDYEEDWLETLCEDCHSSKGDLTERFFSVLVDQFCESQEFLIGFCLGRQLAASVQGGPPCHEIHLESEEEIRGALCAWTQGRGVEDFSSTSSGLSVYEYLISNDGTASGDDPELLPGLRSISSCY